MTERARKEKVPIYDPPIPGSKFKPPIKYDYREYSDDFCLTYSHFMERPIDKIPVIRLFGSTKRG